MRLMEANVGDVLERYENGVRVEATIRSVEKEHQVEPRDRNFVTYIRNGDYSRVFTATWRHDDASEPETRAASDWTQVTDQPRHVA